MKYAAMSATPTVWMLGIVVGVALYAWWMTRDTDRELPEFTREPFGCCDPGLKVFCDTGWTIWSRLQTAQVNELRTHARDEQVRSEWRQHLREQFTGDTRSAWEAHEGRRP